MEINSINNSSISGTQAKSEERKQSKKAENSAINSTKHVDKLELSEEAKLAKLLDYNSIKDKIKTGFYDNPDVLREVAQRLSNEIPVEAKE